ncbi:MAG: hypothetical protein ACRDIY_20770 [Chloroflexota bacterium]
MATSTRDQLHQLVEKLPDSELDAARRYLEYLETTGKLPRILAEAPEEPEPVSPDEAAALASAEAQVARGELVPDAEVDRALARARHSRR